ncbi:unnamed protein product, partial [Mesorhabditis spiculigera]
MCFPKLCPCLDQDRIVYLEDQIEVFIAFDDDSESELESLADEGGNDLEHSFFESNSDEENDVLSWE